MLLHYLAWVEAKERAEQSANSKNLLLKDFRSWSGLDFINDFYRLRNADQLALSDIDNKRMTCYQLLIDYLLAQPVSKNFKELWLFASIFKKQLGGDSAGDFEIFIKSK